MQQLHWHRIAGGHGWEWRGEPLGGVGVGACNRAEYTRHNYRYSYLVVSD